MTLLTWHNYKYYPYEIALAEREAISLLTAPQIKKKPNGIEVKAAIDLEPAQRLTYFAEVINSHGTFETLQNRLENATRLGRGRQATRYSVHGLHEYKGKFNPQVAKALLNIFFVCPGQRVIDPFCGSGTTLVECAHLGATGYGCDLNPFAVYMSNAKLQALATPIDELKKIGDEICTTIRRSRKRTALDNATPRSTYLQSWFDQRHYLLIEMVRAKILKVAGPRAPIFLAIASNLLRDYSLQDPSDLRIRRRQSPLPDIPLLDALIAAIKQVLTQIANTQEILGHCPHSGKAELQNVTMLSLRHVKRKFDAAITSPPYAMALPYVDTQRLSLVWLDLIGPKEILPLEATLIGARELRGAARRQLFASLNDNAASLPTEQAEYCAELQAALGNYDGFRRQAMPILLYRYFTAMRDSFKAIHKVMKRRKPYGLIVGHNHTTLGGQRFDIDTPTHLAELAQSCGWNVDELIPLQTYRRYGYHMNNSVKAETLIILRS